MASRKQASSTSSILKELSKSDPDWALIERLSSEIVDQTEGRVRFTVDAGHLSRIGAELVGRQETALSELIKNAYDADASFISLDFKDYETRGGTLTITDDGDGMTEATIRSSWMRLSTNDKIENPTSKIYGRVRAGQKGIGRFAVQRLGKRLVLITKPRDAAAGYRVEFNWDEEFTAGRNLQQIFNQITKFAKARDDHGTVLEIVDLRDGWSQSALDRVWRSILLLQPPFDPKLQSNTTRNNKRDPGFRVTINGENAGHTNNLFSLEKNFLDQALATIEATVSEKGVATVSVRSKKLALNDKHTLPDKYLLTGVMKLKSHYFIYSSSTLSGMSMTDAAALGRQYGGVRVYRNGFRVMPYGEPADDWLKLDADTARRSLLVAAQNRNFFGQIILRDGNALFEETSSREGLIENQAFDELRGFARAALEWAAIRIAATRNRKQTAGQRDFIPTPRPSEAIRRLREKAGSVEAPPHSLLGQAQAGLSLAEKVATQYEAAVDAERAASLEYEEMLRLLASLGLSISIFSHEIQGSRSGVTARLALLKKSLPAVTSPAGKDLHTQVVKLEKDADRLFDLGGYVAGLMNNAEVRALHTHSVLGAIERFVQMFSGYTDRQGITVDTAVSPKHLRTCPMHGAELDSVLLNFLTNSVKALKRSKADERRIKIDARLEGKRVVVGFEDNGPGIAEEDKGRVFDAFFTTTHDMEADGVAGPGSGLGLKIVSDIAQSYGGEARLGVPAEGYNCRFEFLVLADA